MRGAYGVGIAPVRDLVGSTDFSIAVQCVHSCIAGDMNLIWVARKNDCHASTDVVAIFAYGHLTNTNALSLSLNESCVSSGRGHTFDIEN